MNSSLPAVNKAATIRDLLDKSKDQLKMAIPRHMSVDRLLRIAMTSIQTNYRLLECDPKSLLSCVMQAAQLGLEPDGVLGRAYLIPYKVKGRITAQLQIGYRGFIDLAYRSGQVKGFFAHNVHENDEFDFSYGLAPKLTHVPAQGNRGDLIASYAVVRIKDADPDFEVMWRSDLEKIRQSSKASNDGPWKTHFEEMCRKTPIRRLAKRVPLSSEFMRAANIDDYADAGIDMSIAPSMDLLDQPESPESVIADIKTKVQEVKEEKLEPDPTEDPYVNKNLTSKEQIQPEDPPPSHTEDPPPPDDPPTDHGIPASIVRVKWINLRGPGFATFVYENLDEIRETPEYHKEMKKKWAGLYKGKNDVWPLDMPDHQHPEDRVQEDDPPSGGGQTLNEQLRSMARGEGDGDDDKGDTEPAVEPDLVDDDDLPMLLMEFEKKMTNARDFKSELYDAIMESLGYSNVEAVAPEDRSDVMQKVFAKIMG
jgi:recombination protein RecT